MSQDMKILLPKPGEDFNSFYQPIAGRQLVLVCDQALFKTAPHNLRKAIVLDGDNAYLVDNAHAKKVARSIFKTRTTIRSVAGSMGASSIAVFGREPLQWFRSLNARSMEDSSGLIGLLATSVKLAADEPQRILTSINRGDVVIPVMYDPATKVCHPLPVAG